MLDKTGEAHPITSTAKLRIGTDRQFLALQDVHYVKGKELAPELTAVLVGQTSEVSSLRNFEQKGMLLRIQQLEVTTGQLVWQAAVYIEQFLSSRADVADQQLDMYRLLRATACCGVLFLFTASEQGANSGNNLGYCDH